jgi:hypothetical protein
MILNADDDLIPRHNFTWLFIDHDSSLIPLSTMVNNIPAVQRAWTVVKRGKPANALVLRSDWPVPQKLEKGEVLVKVQAAALNPV